ncbi:39S ribosomal mitochondrial [Chlorella sorokiniana]|uniref:Large ribosomal subunit protein mL45 n=1 Tax=Chlorella sorokiniana TaxID=3076 RepID=A0A2P6TZD5_CHLSO|nr:39S ribosomal mitochondrial [Chlorella sorokiniana]|eukprot:PRW59403.1 39S ribosomal mitochondrial [Chlorella sorokiniana]
MLRRSLTAAAGRARQAAGTQKGFAELLSTSAAAAAAGGARAEGTPLLLGRAASAAGLLSRGSGGAACLPAPCWQLGAARGYAQMGTRMPKTGYKPPAEMQRAMQMRLSMVSSNLLAEPYRGKPPPLPLTAYFTVAGWKEAWRRFMSTVKTFFTLAKCQKLIPGFKRQSFKAESLELYKEICGLLAAGNKTTLRQLVTPAVFSDMKRQLKQREDGGWAHVQWDLVKEPSVDDLLTVHGRLIMIDPKDDTSGFAQITMRIPSQQRFAAYDRQGKLVAGNPEQAIDVEDFWVFEHALKKSPANRWRLAGRLSILPSAVEQKQAAGEGEQQGEQAAAAQQPAAEPAAPAAPVMRMGHVAEQQRQAAQPAWSAGQKQKQKAAAGRGRRRGGNQAACSSLPMRGARWLLLGLLVAGAAAACVQNQDGCLTCSADGESCTECDSSYSLSGGACTVKCSGGASDSGARCSQCDANDPSICLRCEATSSDVGAYIDSSGACKACPSGCVSCRDGDGSCNEVQSGKRAKEEDSGSSSGSSSDSGSGSDSGSSSGSGSEGGSGCPEHCSSCDSGKCSECKEGWVLDESGACVQCAENCVKCKPSSSGGTKCVKCSSGYGPSRGRCQSCSSPACTSCPDGPAQCSECREGFVAYGGGCSKCSVSSCVRCDSADPNRCLECAGSLGADTSGKCIEGQVKHCKSIDPSNASNCLRCADGYSPVTDGTSGATTCEQAPAPATQKLRLRCF